MNNIQWIWFDLDDTLHDFSYTLNKAVSFSLETICKRINLPFEIARNNYQQVIEAKKRLEFADGRDATEYRRERFRGATKGSQLSEEENSQLIEEVLVDYDYIYMNSLVLKNGAVDLLKHLKAAQYKLAILTDGPQDIQKRVLDKLDLQEYFDAVYISGELRISKSQGMLPIVLDKLKISSNNAIMIGDSLERDVQPALAAGIKPIWYNETHLPNNLSCDEVSRLEQISNIIL